MNVITIAHQKGGVGKTTLAINLAYAFSESLRVAIVDADAQGSVSDLSQFLTGIDVVSLDELLKNQLGSYDLVIVDTPPYLSSRLTDLFALSNFVLVPTKAGVLDAMAIRATIALLSQSMEAKPGLRAGIVLNMVLTSTSLTDEVRTLLAGYPVPLLKSVLTQRVSYARSPMTGGVFGSEDNRAKQEMVELATELIDHLRTAPITGATA